MRRLLVLFSAFLVLTIFTSSAALAARPTFACRIHSLVAMFRVNAFPFCGSCLYIGVEDAEGGGAGYILGGDADDFGNGRNDGSDLVPDPKSPLRLLRDRDRKEPKVPEEGVRGN